MPGFKVSYKILREQGEGMKNIAKAFDRYIDEVAKINSQIGSEGMLAKVRSNLSKLQDQLSEVSDILLMGGDVLLKVTENYGGAEKRQLKRSGATKAHNRDFYKRPVVVVPAGGGTAAVQPQVTYVDQSTHVTTFNVVTEAPSVTQASPETPLVTPPVTPPSALAASGPDGSVGLAIGGVAAAGAMAAGLRIKGKQEAKKEADSQAESAESPELDGIIAGAKDG